jgi:hypothetical protein
VKRRTVKFQEKDTLVKVWANLKKKIKQILHEFENLGEAIDYAFGQY